MPITLFLSCSATAPVGPRRLLLEISISHSDTHHTRQDSSGRVISPSQRPLRDNTQHSQEKNSHVSGRIRTRNPSKRSAECPRVRPRGHWDRLWLRSAHITERCSSSAGVTYIDCKLPVFRDVTRVYLPTRYFFFARTKGQFIKNYSSHFRASLCSRETICSEYPLLGDRKCVT
jgi:hypothetical protein